MTTANQRGGSLRRVLVPNRGEIAVRVLRACAEEGIRSVAALSRVDAESLPARLADDWVCLEGESAADTYLSVAQVVAAAILAQCDAVHPGYGFLSERPELAESCGAHGITFVGPTSETIRRGGDKVEARALAASLGIPVGRGSDSVDDVATAVAGAARAGYPVLLKAAAGGGGRGMVLVGNEADLPAQFERAREEAHKAFGDSRLFVEHYVENARHVEVQIIGDHHGTVVHLGDRDCSYQRRYQKLIEEAPASAVSPTVRAGLADAAVTLGRALGYVGAGTVEFLVDQETDTFSFLELNTRVQVEHPATEMVTGIDIVREQLRVAAGNKLSFRQSDVALQGHAIECRINAESARDGFLPAPGRLVRWAPPIGEGVRVDTHCFEGYTVPPDYDSLLAKLVVAGPDRACTITRLVAALDGFQVQGIANTIDFHRAVATHPDFIGNSTNTKWVERTFLPGWGSSAGMPGHCGVEPPSLRLDVRP